LVCVILKLFDYTYFQNY